MYQEKNSKFKKLAKKTTISPIKKYTQKSPGKKLMVSKKKKLSGFHKLH